MSSRPVRKKAKKGGGGMDEVDCNRDNASSGGKSNAGASDTNGNNANGGKPTGGRKRSNGNKGDNSGEEPPVGRKRNMAKREKVHIIRGIDAPPDNTHRISDIKLLDPLTNNVYWRFHKEELFCELNRDQMTQLFDHYKDKLIDEGHFVQDLNKKDILRLLRPELLHPEE